MIKLGIAGIWTYDQPHPRSKFDDLDRLTTVGRQFIWVIKKTPCDTFRLHMLIEVNWTLNNKWPFLKCKLFNNEMNFLKKKKKIVKKIS